MFELDLRSRVPIYEQLADKIIELIINKVLKPDEQLPSVRTLSGDLTINPNTIQKAYRELENRGYIYSLPGKGNFVKPAVPGGNSARLNILEVQLKKVLTEMLYLGISPEELIIKTKKLLLKSQGGETND